MTGKRGRRAGSGRSSRRAAHAGGAAETSAAAVSQASAEVVAGIEPGGADASGSAVTASVVQGTVVNATAADGAPVAAFVPDDAVVRRTKDGWRVGSDDLPDLTCAMILADLLAAENGMSEPASAKPSLGRLALPARPAACGRRSGSSSMRLPPGSGWSRRSGYWPNGTGLSPGRHSSSSVKPRAAGAAR